MEDRDQDERPIDLAGFPASWTKVDAAVNWGNGRIYLFNGSEYIRFDTLTNKIAC